MGNYDNVLRTIEDYFWREEGLRLHLVEAKQEWQCFVDCNLVEVYFYEQPELDTMFQKVCEDLGLEVQFNPFLMSLLHEIGHIATVDEVTDDDWILPEVYAQFMELFDFPMYEAFHNKYFYFPRERVATQWAVDYANNNVDKINGLFAELRKVWAA